MVSSSGQRKQLNISKATKQIIQLQSFWVNLNKKKAKAGLFHFRTVMKMNNSKIIICFGWTRKKKRNRQQLLQPARMVRFSFWLAYFHSSVDSETIRVCEFFEWKIVMSLSYSIIINASKLLFNIFLSAITHRSHSGWMSMFLASFEHKYTHTQREHNTVFDLIWYLWFDVRFKCLMFLDWDLRSTTRCCFSNTVLQSKRKRNNY